MDSTTTQASVAETKAADQNMNLKISLGTVGGVLGVGAIISVVVVITYVLKQTGTNVAEIAPNFTKSNYLSRGVRGKYGY